MENNPLGTQTKKHTTSLSGLLVLAIVVVAIALLGSRVIGPPPPDPQARTGSVAGVRTVTHEATVVVNTGTGLPRNMSFDLAGDETAFDLLTRASLRENFVVETQQYDFGIMINKIDGVGAEENRYWMYYINGASANIGADSYMVKPGDVIEFRYE
ncbi:MAG: hypothetical protein A2898_05850 [Candidatus Kerfeldbacteria bacterium RIFCSPLOWO2_01_FULL_48_11]|uniref:Transcobalamin-like C-terminal domain-containing protein n=1 Tax=Candidatus Kerfeldbacteria bacterium RIFCSPLOWO2_01_FULL_48_11 TaxID=1798543 RepID=A0A1G2B3D1_9BACT|nr:MAG: cell wall anchor domain-containing protein [Parcubacteria group bacterium GW2011_GWA2_48_9]KKW15199.1 MAG: cell wall anchor domain-containing protein [Parcubacteria group bacterium GW2011_GWC2_49_9]OGY83674.1 MAG: hypothetical protein A2898_05850 [Candidatus Kerfeldbacteria bacterium RIFCSPLOWO2_01_FULL_48_11]